MFKDLKVLELAGVLAGPAVGMFFAELGATVIKIENPHTDGDITRSWKLPAESPEKNTSAYFASANWGKEHRFIDLHDAAGRQQVLNELKDADIVICNWKKNDDVKFLLDYNSVRQINPEIIYATLTGFGNDDDRVAYDVVLQAETGWMFMNGIPESGPVKIPVAVIDLFAAHQLKEGILVAMLQKMKSGKGAHVSVSLFDAAVAALANQASNYLTAQHVPQRIGSLHPNIAPYGEMLHASDDKFIVLAVGTDHQFMLLCDMLEIPELKNDLRFTQNNVRVKNREALKQILLTAAQHFDSKYLMQRCLELKIPAGKINDLQELFENTAAQKLILKDEFGSRVRTAIFSIT